MKNIHNIKIININKIKKYNIYNTMYNKQGLYHKNNRLLKLIK